MSNDEHHIGALLETVRAELDRAHRGALAMDASEIRRGLQIALTAIQDAIAQGGAEPSQILTDASAKLTRALADLDGGALAEMDTLIEEVRAIMA